MYNNKVQRLLDGETITTSERGQSMTPLIKSNQEHVVSPITWEECEVGDIVYCKVRGNYYTHLVKAKNDKTGVLIGNNHGRINGWTKKVYGKVIKVL
jgi:3-phenylpropionate/cinnamic acid dioxygenase small subunit